LSGFRSLTSSLTAEAWKRIGDMHSRTRLTPFDKRLFERLLAWQR